MYQFRTWRLLSFVALATLLAATVSSARTAAAIAPTDPSNPGEQLLMQLRQQTGSALTVAYHAETGALRFFATDSAHPIVRSPSLTADATPEQVSRAFLATYGTLFGLRDQASELAVMHNQQIDQHNFVRFQQQYQGVPVLAGEVTVQTDRKRNVLSANGELLPKLDLSVQPALDAATASQTALTTVAKTYTLPINSLHAATPQLWIFDPALLGGPGIRRARLVWRTEVTASNTGVPVRELVLVDAQLGAVALHFNQITDAKERHVCNNNSVIDADGNEKNNCPSSAYLRSEGQAAVGNTDTDLAYDYSGLTYDYFFTTFGRDSLDGRGLPLISVVNYCKAGKNGCPYPNAFWDGQQMTYGEGFASGDDVVAHELTHGFTEFTSHLFYYYQSGAINESMSDVFGELIDQTDGVGNDTAAVRWQLGEDLPASVGVIRDMSNPPRFDNPDWTGSAIYTGDASDSGGVHSNSGVNNKAAYLLTDGGTFRGTTTIGLGALKVGALYYLVSTAFLTSGSDYQDLGSYLQAACATLASSGAYGYTAGDCVQVQKVVAATGMSTTPENAPVPEATACASGLTSSDLFFDDLEDPARGNWVSAATDPGTSTVNEWYYPASNNPYASVFDGSYATSGSGNMWGNNVGDPAPQAEEPAPPPADYNIAMTRDIAVPANAFLHFRHSFDFEADASSDYDGGVVEYSTNGGSSWNDAGPLFAASGGANGYNTILDSTTTNPLAGREAFGNVSQGYYSSRADLQALAGQNVRFRFRIGTDAYVGFYGWFLDDIRVYTCTSTPPTVGFRVPSANANVRTGSVAIDIALSGVTTRAVTVPFTVGGTATPGSDYVLTTSAVVIPAGTASGRLVIRLINDGQPHDGKTMVVTLGTPTNATLGGSGSMAIALRDSAGSNRVYIPFTLK